CDAEMGVIANRDGNVYRVVSTFAFSQEWTVDVRKLVVEPGRGTLIGRTAAAREIVQIEDIAADPDYALPEAITVGKIRTNLGVLLLRGGEPIGVLSLVRQRVEPFTDRQIELLRTFADQAVIAIENTRLLHELRESLEQQQAMAEVLQVINVSPADLQPVFEAMLDKAMRLCGAAFGLLSTYDGERFHQVVLRQADDAEGEPARFAEYLAVPSNQPGPGSASDRLLSGEQLVHISDLSDEEIYRSGDPYRRAFVDLGRARTLLAVPLRKDNAFLGVVNIWRQEVHPFSDKQIALLENFAAQAVV